jgi:transcriptional regulator with XRE-family HTH domain
MAKRRTRGPSPQAEALIRDSLRTFKGRLQTALKEMGIDARELSRRSGVSESAISRSATGMNLWIAIAIARALGLRVGWLVANEEPQWVAGHGPRRAPAPSPNGVAEIRDADDEEERELSRAPRRSKAHGHRRTSHQP